MPLSQASCVCGMKTGMFSMEAGAPTCRGLWLKVLLQCSTTRSRPRATASRSSSIPRCHVSTCRCVGQPPAGDLTRAPT
eukprot:6833544-Pyramimonas_sp.AAC.1